MLTAAMMNAAFNPLFIGINPPSVRTVPTRSKQTFKFSRVRVTCESGKAGTNQPKKHGQKTRPKAQLVTGI